MVSPGHNELMSCPIEYNVVILGPCYHKYLLFVQHEMYYCLFKILVEFLIH